MTLTREEFNRYIENINSDTWLHQGPFIREAIRSLLPSEKGEKREEGLTDEMVSEIINDEIDTMRKMDRKSGLIIEKHPIEIHKDEKEEIMKGDWVYDLDGRRVQVYKTFAGRASCYDESKKYLYTYSLSQLSKTKPEKREEEVCPDCDGKKYLNYGPIEHKEKCKKCNGTGWIEETHRGRIYDMDTYGESGRKCPDCVKEPILEYKGFKVGDRVSLKDWPEEERVIKSFDELDYFGMCAMFDSGGFEPVDGIEYIPPADGGKEEEVDMKGLLCEGCGRTHLRCKCPENSVEFWKHRCEQWEKRWKGFVEKWNKKLFESQEDDNWVGDTMDDMEEEYPLDRK